LSGTNSVGGIPIGGLLEKPVASFATEGPAWFGYIGVENVDASLDRLLKAGGVVHRAVEDIPAIGRFAVVADPQGAPFVLFQSPAAAQQDERPSPGTPGTGAWHDLAAIDWQSDFDFYSKMFGWTKSDAVDMGPNGVYQIFSAGSERLGGMMTRMDPNQSPGWLYYFHVDDIGTAIARATDHGGKIVHGPSVVPGGQQIAHCLDPQGAIFGMVSPQ
jgi:predicted enzyme related to lactoylglutathione lyase